MKSDCRTPQGDQALSLASVATDNDTRACLPLAGKPASDKQENRGLRRRFLPVSSVEPDRALTRAWSDPPDAAARRWSSPVWLYGAREIVAPASTPMSQLPAARRIFRADCGEEAPRALGFEHRFAAVAYDISTLIHREREPAARARSNVIRL